jgi:hypothetical protein
MAMTIRALEQAVEALRRDPTHPVRARVDDLIVELRAVVEPAVEAPGSVVGLFADEPGLMDDVCEQALKARERDRVDVDRDRHPRN